MLDLSTVERPPARVAPPAGDLAAVSLRLRDAGHAFVEAATMRRAVEAAGGRDWHAFASSWDDLGSDRFMADGGTYRKRRFACLSVGRDAVRVKPAQPHYQTLDNNPLNGGVARVFDPVAARIVHHPITRAVLGISRSLFETALVPPVRAPAWHVEMHQFRIEARPDAAGCPTPEGLHRDGVDGVLVMMVRRENVEGGESTIADAGRRPLRRSVLAEPFDASFVDDRRVYHGVSPVTARDPARPAFRDVLVLTFRAEAA